MHIFSVELSLSLTICSYICLEQFKLCQIKFVQNCTSLISKSHLCLLSLNQLQTNLTETSHQPPDVLSVKIYLRPPRNFWFFVLNLVSISSETFIYRMININANPKTWKSKLPVNHHVIFLKHNMKTISLNLP